MDSKDKKLLNNLQENFPLIPRPYEKIAGKVKISEKDVLKRMKKLKDQGIIRRFGILINHKRLKYFSTLLGVKVSAAKLPGIVKKLVSYPEITHCYERVSEYNLWFTFLTPSKPRFKKFYAWLKNKVGAKNIMNMETVRSFKLKTTFKLK